jgi:hypothetical protein
MSDIVISEIQNHLSKRVLDNCKILTNTDLNQNYVYHITKSKIRGSNLIPTISRRALSGEDNTTPRVCVAANIVDCLTGYGDAEYDILETDVTEKGNIYLNGYYIYRIPFGVVLKPNKELVSDSIYSNELWLVKYSKETSEYPAQLIGTMFIDTITINTKNNKNPDLITKYYVSVDDTVPLSTSKNIIKYCSFTRSRDDVGIYYKPNNKDNDFQVLDFNEIPKSEYESKKKLSAALLSFENRPLFLDWK